MPSAASPCKFAQTVVWRSLNSAVLKPGPRPLASHLDIVVAYLAFPVRTANLPFGLFVAASSDFASELGVLDLLAAAVVGVGVAVAVVGLVAVVPTASAVSVACVACSPHCCHSLRDFHS